MKHIVFFSLLGIIGALISILLFPQWMPYTIHAVINPAYAVYLAEMKVFEPNKEYAFAFDVLLNTALFLLYGIFYRMQRYKLFLYGKNVLKWLYIVFVVGVFVFEFFIVR